MGGPRLASKISPGTDFGRGTEISLQIKQKQPYSVHKLLTKQNNAVLIVGMPCMS